MLIFRKQGSDRMLDSVSAYYKAKGIGAEAFDCLHGRVAHGSCRASSRDFVTTRE